MKTLMEESKQVFTKNLVTAKLWRRFWRGLNMYNDQQLNYLDIIEPSAFNVVKNGIVNRLILLSIFNLFSHISSDLCMHTLKI
jgi:hypothetical protein